MLKLITLHTIKSIFDNATCEVSSLSKMIYVNCLIHHFGDLEPIEENSVGFELSDEEVKFEKFKKNFQELKKAEIVNIGFDCYITFYPLWNRYIDKTLIEKKKVVVDEKEIFAHLSNEMFLDIVCIKNKISVQYAKVLIQKFAMEQLALNKKHFSESDCKKHFLNWVKYNIVEQGHNKVAPKILAR